MQALSDTGQPVDWFFAYKCPELSGGAQCDAATGYEYAYADAGAPKPQRSPCRLDQSDGAVHRTLALLSAAGASYVLYNDEQPDPVVKPDNDGLGHTKGVLGWGAATRTGFWMIHSWPKFPDLNATKAPTPIYGQTFLCLSLSLESLGRVALQMVSHQEPQVYGSRLPDGTVDGDGLVPAGLRMLAAGQLSPRPAPAFDRLDLTTLGGMPFSVLAKNRQWNDDFWNDGVGPALGTDLKVETWIRGPIAPVADKDGVHKVFDVKYVNLGPLGIHWAWPETSDHAKHAISSDPKDAWVIVGDINRMVSQRKRGGGAVAFQNLDLWSALSQTDLVLAPPGMDRSQAIRHVQKSHPKPAAE